MAINAGMDMRRMAPSPERRMQEKDAARMGVRLAVSEGCAHIVVIAGWTQTLKPKKPEQSPPALANSQGRDLLRQAGAIGNLHPNAAQRRRTACASKRPFGIFEINRLIGSSFSMRARNRNRRTCRRPTYRRFRRSGFEHRRRHMGVRANHEAGAAIDEMAETLFSLVASA